MPSLARPSRRSLGAFSRGSCHDWVYPSFWGCLSLCLCIPPHDFHLGVHLPLFMLIDFFLCLLLSPGLAFSLSFFLPPTHTHCHTLTHTHALLHTLTTLSSSHNLIYIHTLYTQTFTHTPTHTHTLSATHSHTQIHSPTPHTHTVFHNTVIYSFTRVDAHPHTHTHNFHVLKHTYTLLSPSSGVRSCYPSYQPPAPLSLRLEAPAQPCSADLHGNHCREGRPFRSPQTTGPPEHEQTLMVFY